MTLQLGQTFRGPYRVARESERELHAEVSLPGLGVIGWGKTFDDALRIADALCLLDTRDEGRDQLAALAALRRDVSPVEDLIQEIAACLTALSDLDEARPEVHRAERHLVRALAALGNLVEEEAKVVATPPPREHYGPVIDTAMRVAAAAARRRHERPDSPVDPEPAT